MLKNKYRYDVDVVRNNEERTQSFAYVFEQKERGQVFTFAL